MEKSTDERRFGRTKNKVTVTTDVSAKIKTIWASAMPEAQKAEYEKILLGTASEPSEGKLTYNVYVKIKGIAKEIQQAMLAYPKAKSVRLATLAEWDEIFQDF